MAMKTNSVFFEDSSQPFSTLRTSTTPKRQWTCSPCTPRNTRQAAATSAASHSSNGTPRDRYVPSRATRDLAFTRFQMSTPCRTRDNENTSAMRECLLATKGQSSDDTVLSFQGATPVTATKYDYWSGYSTMSPTSSPGKKLRKAPKSADKVLDAPNLANDFYLNLLDWSKRDMVSVALGSAVYVFNADQGDVHQLCDLNSLYVTSVQWNTSGKYLAVGTSDAQVQLWDVNSSKCIRKMSSHQSRVSSLSWRPKCSLLSSGSQNGQVHNYDVRAAQFRVQALNAHTLDVCGLKWSSSGRFLASGGNDNVVNIWDTYNSDPWTAPSHAYKSHTAAVKALSWCPWQPNVLATGGGSADRSIHLWNVYTGESQGQVATDSQVSGLAWSSEHKELLSCHGNPSNSLRLWQWQVNSPAAPLSQVAEMPGHEGRILHVATSPDGQTVATAGADETLRFWKCFESRRKKVQHKTSHAKFIHTRL